jgi:hypothetical protein
VADTAKEAMLALKQQHDRQRFMSLSLEERLRNTCPGCGCRLIGDDFARAVVFVTGPPKTGRCVHCGWTGTR